MAAECSQFWMVLLRLRNFLCLCSGMSFRNALQALFMVWTVQCFRGRPTRFRCARFGDPRGPLKVACRVGASGTSRRVWISSLCCAFLIWVETLGTRCSCFFRPSPQRADAARFRTSLLVLALLMYVVCILRILRSPFSWKVASLRFWCLVSCMVSSAYVSLVFMTAFQYCSFVLVEHLPIFQSRSNRFHVMADCFIRSRISISGWALSVRSTPRYLACFVCFTFLLFVNLGVRRPW